MTRPRKEAPRSLPGSASKEQRFQRGKDRAAQMADPGNNDQTNPDRVKWGWIAAVIFLIAGLSVAIVDSITGGPLKG